MAKCQVHKLNDNVVEFYVHFKNIIQVNFYDDFKFNNNNYYKIP
jgi:hypothetical protein